MKNFLSQLFSIDESKKSMVVLILIAFAVFGLYKLYIGTDVPNNVMTIILTLSGVVFGVNSISSIANVISTAKQNVSQLNQVKNEITNESVQNSSTPTDVV